MKSFGKTPGLRKAPSAIGKASNVTGDRVPLMRAPRLRALATRDYGKGIAPPKYNSPAPSFASIGYGNTGLTGES